MILTLSYLANDYGCYLQRQIPQFFLTLTAPVIMFNTFTFSFSASKRFKPQPFLEVFTEPWGCCAYQHHQVLFFKHCSSSVVHSLFLKLLGPESHNHNPISLFRSFGLCLQNSSSAMTLFLLTLHFLSLAMVLPLPLFEMLLIDTKGSCSSMATDSVFSEHWGLYMMLPNWASMFIPTVRRWALFFLNFVLFFLSWVFIKFWFWGWELVFQLQLGVDESYNLFVSRAQALSGAGQVTIEVWFVFI